MLQFATLGMQYYIKAFLRYSKELQTVLALMVINIWLRIAAKGAMGIKLQGASCPLCASNLLGKTRSTNTVEPTRAVASTSGGQQIIVVRIGMNNKLK